MITYFYRSEYNASQKYFKINYIYTVIYKFTLYVHIILKEYIILYLGNAIKYANIQLNNAQQ